MNFITTLSAEIWWLLGVLFFLFGIISALQAVMETRTPQGAVAWVVSLLTFPFIAVPLYWVFGSRRFRGYIKGADIFLAQKVSDDNQSVMQKFADAGVVLRPLFSKAKAWQRGILPFFSDGNEVTILKNGEESFRYLFRALKSAKKYILIEYYIIQNDETGNQLKDILIAKAQEGVACYVIFDTLGAKKFRSFAKELQEKGVQVSPFDTTREWRHMFRLNFRNHRKIALIDGEQVITGGINIGDEYRDLDKKLTPWRDTNIVLRGPVVLLFQYLFRRDWQYASNKKIPNLNWQVQKSKGQSEVMMVPTSPASIHEYGTLFFLHLIHAAEKRIWIFNPYFVPDEQFVSALQLASMRGVEVKIVTPKMSDGFLVEQIVIGAVESFAHFKNITWYQYQKGFMHQKVFLIDDDLTLIGTHNFDNRSFRLNFEVSALIRDPAFQQEAEKMLREDLEASEVVSKDLYKTLPYYQRLIIRLALLLAPVA